MIKVYYDEAGTILYTLSGDVTPPGDFIEVDHLPEGDIAGFRIEEGEIVLRGNHAEIKLEIEREQMVCSALQGKLALGAERWADVEALLNDTETPWAMKQVILTATEWPRNSQMMTELAWLLDYDDSEVDDLFRLAMSIEV